MTKDEALALCGYLECNDASLQAQCEAAAFIREALAQPPPWWPAVEKILEQYGLQAVEFVADFKAAMKDASQPAQRQPLTDEEIQTIHDTYYRRMGPKEFARAIEAAHGIKETTK